MGIQNLQTAVKNAVDNRIDKEARAFRGTISDGKLQVGNDLLEVFQAVDCNSSDGNRVWALRTRTGKAVIVGA